MLDIEYKGANCVVISTKKDKLIVDPNLQLVGLKNPAMKDAVVIATEERLSAESNEANLSVEGPGEYEVGDFSIKGIQAQRQIDTANDAKLSTIYRIVSGEIRIALIGNIYGKLSDIQMEDIGVVDILILPVGGGGYTLDATSAAQIARSIEAKVIIPLHYQDDGLKYEVPQDSLDIFKKEFSAEVDITPKLKLKGSSALPIVATIVEITRS